MDPSNLGLGPLLLPIPGFLWRRSVERQGARAGRLLARLPEEHRRVRRFVVGELARRGRPVEPAQVARELALPRERVEGILSELEGQLLFVYRDAGGAVEWAYPFTAARTPHRLRFDSGEELHAA